MKRHVLVPKGEIVDEGLAAVRKWKDHQEQSSVRGGPNVLLHSAHAVVYHEQSGSLTATTPTTGSIFAQLRKGLDVPPKHLDLIVKRKETVDISFGEVSYTKDFNKDQGDLCRLAIWSKRALGHLQAEYEELENPQLVFFHTVSTKCTIYQSIKCGGSGRSALVLRSID
ncbi:hypothetical protein BC939DRAFT_149093 [Gamsiella multidivaricata]|uniref:uncharacterized protein n=1 Tax=Gamsiella multidivaricata TaxID=101098 RepID=UPI00221F862B|nr:uncharacterized protein BC939DRAFT_149093 [Gamsiella multidivaricata]KAI7831753.1 hypothetical protein BC939DRAFT_149093 [Gamsiella multidivaricata]